jgi:hypothetical protein
MVHSCWVCCERGLNVLLKLMIKQLHIEVPSSIIMNLHKNATSYGMSLCCILISIMPRSFNLSHENQ